VRYVTYVSPATSGRRVGIVDGDEIRGLVDDGQLIDLLGDDGARLAAAADSARRDPYEVVPLATAVLAAPVPTPPSVRDFMAFEAHVTNSMRALGRDVDPDWYELPVFYFTNPAAVHGPCDEVAVSPGSAQFDYELEVAAVVGREGVDLHPEDAEAHIAGYTILCDWSARDVQMREMRQLLGPVKGKDSATSLGPMLVTPDELAPYRRSGAFDLGMRAFVNDRQYSQGTLADLYWTFGQMLAYASRGTRLVPGDVIGCGTVGTGCILELSRLHGSEAYPWLQPGDEVRLEVDQLGEIRARIAPGAPVVSLRPERPAAEAS